MSQSLWTGVAIGMGIGFGVSFAAAMLLGHILHHLDMAEPRVWTGNPDDEIRELFLDMNGQQP